MQPPRVREVIRRLKQEGWQEVRVRGSHRQYQHPTKPGTVTVSGALGDTMPRGTYHSVAKQAGWR